MMKVFLVRLYIIFLNFLREPVRSGHLSDYNCSNSTGSMMVDESSITKLLQAHAMGDSKALDKLMPLVYDQMQQMAHQRLIRERPDHTFSTTALVHEAYLKLVDLKRIDWKNRAQFFGIASKIMRNILVDYAVRKKAEKRGGKRERVTLGESDAVTEINLHDILSIHHALKRLESVDERQVRVVECRFFGGLTIDETAAALDISTPTVSRDWKMARAWLNRELSLEK
jgi:RNA polymerase sigma factor (TIGR02999 family)